jgi:amino-acid N-acetyltransferase
LPLKAWKDCLRCPKFQACDEIAVLRILRPERWNAQVWRMAAHDDQFIQIPIPQKE